jgi:general secretion pathway protein G
VRRAFTLIELVVVILILGILAGVAARRMFNTSDLGADNCTRESLAVVRDAIQLFEAQNGRLPGADGNQATFKSDLAPFIRRFPVLAAGRS